MSRIRLSRFQRLRWKLAVAFVVLATPPLLAAALYVFLVVPRDLEQDAVESLRTQHRAGIDLIDRYLAGVSEDALVLARLPAVVELATGDAAASRAVERQFRIVVEEHETYLQLRYLDAAGREVVRINREPGGGVRVVEPAKLQDKVHRYYTAAAAAMPPGDVYISPLDLNREHGVIEEPHVPVVRFATSVRGSDGTPAGSVVINVAAQGLVDGLRAVPGGGTDGSLLLIDDRGYFMLHTDPERSWSGPADLDTGWNYFDAVPELAAMLVSTSADGAPPSTDAGGPELRASGSQIVAGYVGPSTRGERWLLIATAPRSAILAPATRLRLTLLGVFVAMALAGAAVIWFAVGRLSRPARMLQEGAARIGSGDFDHRIDLATGDELNDVANAFNDMAGQLRESYRVLEQRVADRTRDLQDRDEKLRALSEMGMALVEERSPDAVAEQASAYARRLVGAHSVELTLMDGGDDVDRRITAHESGNGADGWEAVSKAEAEEERLRIPVAARGRTLGHLCVVGPADGRPLTETDRELLETLASHVAVAIVNARLHAREQATVTRLEELNQAKSDFTSAVSHQLRSPVAAVRGYADILRGHGDDLTAAQRDRIIDDIATQTGNLSELVEDVLRVSRIDSGRLDIVKRPCLLGPVIQEAAHDAEPVAAAPRIRLHRPAQPVMVDADPALLKQVFLNLLENALRYSPEGSPVDVSWRLSADGRFAVADVWDRGPGVPPADRERVFDRFVRLSPAPGRPDVAGTGLGLYIARSILDAHGGDLRVEDGEGGGARFVLRLPLAGAEA